MSFVRACGVQNPSWLEIRNFVMFLNIQLHSCQNSELCNVNSASEGMKGLKGFVVKFMIRMSRVSCNVCEIGIRMRPRKCEMCIRDRNKQFYS